VDTKTEALLDFCVKKSLGYSLAKAKKYSIVECAHNEFLDPEYNPFTELELRLMVNALKTKYNIKDKDAN
jgi:hypothetical protein